MLCTRPGYPIAQPRRPDKAFTSQSGEATGVYNLVAQSGAAPGDSAHDITAFTPSGTIITRQGLIQVPARPARVSSMRDNAPIHARLPLRRT